MEDLRPITTVETDSALSKDQQDQVRWVLGRVPVIGLPHSGMGKKPETFNELLAVVASLGEELGKALRRDQATSDELNTLKYDLKAAGRVFKLITDEEQ